MAARIRRVSLSTYQGAEPARTGDAHIDRAAQRWRKPARVLRVPPGTRRVAIDLVTRDLAGLKRVARREGWKLSGAAERAFLVQGAGPGQRRRSHRSQRWRSGGPI